MSIDRPTFHESWYRIRNLRLRLRPGVTVHRRWFRGSRWYVVQDPATDRYFRMSDGAYRFAGLLDGRRTVDEAWRLAEESAGDEAPTQGEAIRLLGQLFSSDLLVGETPPDAGALLRRYRQRTTRQLRGHMESFLFIRIPLVDPDRFLARLAPLFRWLFTPLGLLLWLAVVGWGVWQIVGGADSLAAAAARVLAPENLIALYLAVAVLKLLHELGHGLACKVFGTRQGTGGAVHTLGVMFLVFIPLPYVDASSAWALRSKAQRLVVSAAGMMTELVCAAIAAGVWARAAEGTPLSTMAFNVMLAASVSTILFNANPLLRFDGYYILCDLLETPNLAQRARETVHHFVKRRLWGARRIATPQAAGSERAFLWVYWVASVLYRIVLYASIILFVADQLFVIGVAMALGAIAVWVVAPLWRFLSYLLMSDELARTRPRAIGVTAAAGIAVVAIVGLIPVPDRAFAWGHVEAEQTTGVFAPERGFLHDAAPDGAHVSPIDGPLVAIENPLLLAARDEAWAEVEALRHEYAVALTRGASQTEIARERLAAATKQLERLEARVRSLRIEAPHVGIWTTDRADLPIGSYLDSGRALGAVADASSLRIRALTTQAITPRLRTEAAPNASIRVPGRQGPDLRAALVRVSEAAAPSPPAAPSRAADQEQRETGAEAILRLEGRTDLRLGQRVLIRFDLGSRPIARQAARLIAREFQRRFGD